MERFKTVFLGISMAFGPKEVFYKSWLKTHPRVWNLFQTKSFWGPRGEGGLNG